MASNSPPSTSSALSTPAAMDSAALRSCPNCRRRMSSLKHDSHTICSQCRAVSCSVETRCSECKDWSIDAMQDRLKYQRSLARKSSNRKPAVTAASGSQPAVSSSPVGPSFPLTPAVSGSSQLQNAVLVVLQSLNGSLGINLNPSSTAPSSVPSGVGAQSSQISPSSVVHSDNISVLPANVRPYLGMSTVTAVDRSAPIGHSPSPLGSSGTDQLQANVSGPLPSSSSALSPNSLLFPLTPSPSFPPSFSSSLPPLPSGSSHSSYSSAASSLIASVSSSSSSSPIPSISHAFTPSSLASASFPSSSFISPSLAFPSSSLLTPSASSSSGSCPPLYSSPSFHSSPLPSSSSSASSLSSVPPPPGFPSSFSSQGPPSFSSFPPLPPLHPPPVSSSSASFSFLSFTLPPVSGVSSSSSVPFLFFFLFLWGGFFPGGPPGALVRIVVRVSVVGLLVSVFRWY